MLTRRIFTIVILLAFPLLNGITGNEKLLLKESSVIGNLVTRVNKASGNSSSLDSLSFFIRNSSKGTNNFSALSELKEGYEKSYLLSLLQKKKEEYDEMFESLHPHLKSNPDYFPFYDELVFAANASDKLDVLPEESKNLNSPYIFYLSGLIQSAKGKYNEALEFLEKAYGLDSINHNILLQLALVQRNIGNYEKSSSYLEKILDIHKNREDIVASANLALGALFFLSGEYKTADKYYSEALRLALKINDRYTETKAYINIGINRDVEGNPDKARDYYEKALVIASEISDNELKALAFSEYGVSYTYSYDLPNAKRKYLQSYEIFKRSGNKVRLALLSENIGKIYSQYHDYSSAVKYFEEGIRYAGGNKRAVYLNKTGLAGVYNNLGNYARALKLFRECEKISDEIEDNYLKGDVNQGLGILNYNLGRYKNALEFYNNADAYYKKTDDLWYTADINHKTGLVYSNLDKPSAAEQKFKDAIDASVKLQDDYLHGVSLIDYADLKFKLKEYDKALEILKEAELISQKNNFDNLLAELYLTQGRIYEMRGDYFNAKDKFSKSSEICSSSGNSGLLTECLYRQALLHEKFNLPELAESYFKLAVSETENKGRPLFEDQDVQISFFNLSSELYNSYADFYLNKGKYKEAFSIIDRSKSHNSIQNLGNIKLKSLIKKDSLVEQLYEYDWMVHSGIYDSRQTDSVRQLYNNLKENVIKSVPAARYYMEGGRYYSLAEIQQNLSPGENIILIHSAENSTYIFRINSKDFIVRKENISSAEIKKLVSSVSPYYKESEEYSFINQDLFAFNASASSELYSKILKSTVSGIPDDDDLIFIPSPEMLLLPFEFLITDFKENESAYNYDKKSFLVNNYNISYAPSVSVYLNQKRSKINNDDKYLLVGNPFIDNEAEFVSDRRSLFNMDSLSVLPLKYSSEEITEIGSILNTNEILTEENATETNFRGNAENSRIIHISTHSFLMDKQPVIFFSSQNDDENDGFLETSEIIQMNLNSDLVVLSSCNSGIGKIEEAEGVIGMTKALFEAGTKSVIVSLWEVNDKYTSAFMRLFYNHLSKGSSKTEALRQAKLDFIKEYSPNPYYWSAFVLSGNTAGVNIRTDAGLASFIIPLIIFLAALSLLVYYIRRRTIKN